MIDLTIVEESARKIRGLAFILDRMSSTDDLDINEEHMFGLLADTASGIANDLETIIRNRE